MRALRGTKHVVQLHEILCVMDVGQANIRQYSSDPDGLKQAIEDRTIEDVIQLVNSQIRIVESGKVRSGQDPMKRAEDALKGLSSDQRSGLMERLMTEAGA